VPSHNFRGQAPTGIRQARWRPCRSAPLPSGRKGERLEVSTGCPTASPAPRSGLAQPFRPTRDLAECPPYRRGPTLPTPTENQLMAVLIEALGERFELEVLNLETTDLGLTAQLRIHLLGSGGQQASTPAPAHQLRVVPAGDFD
jgi:hypothetical protein